MIYLAGPYTHPDYEVRLQRFYALNRAAGKLLLAGWKVYSPISHSHPIAEACGLPVDIEYWQGLAKHMLERCTILSVLQLPGWEESAGVQFEMGVAATLGMHLEFLPEGFGDEHIR